MREVRLEKATERLYNIPGKKNNLLTIENESQDDREARRLFHHGHKNRKCSTESVFDITQIPNTDFVITIQEYYFTQFRLPVLFSLIWTTSNVS
jgi:hypothetical protein